MEVVVIVATPIPRIAGSSTEKEPGTKDRKDALYSALRTSSRVKLTSLRQIVVVPIITANAD